MTEEVEDFVRTQLEKQFPQLDIDDIFELMDVISKRYEFKDDNIVRIDKYISEKIIMDDRKSFINTDLDLYHQCCENNYDDKDGAMDEYIKRFRAKYGFDVWKSQGYFSDPEKFGCGEYKDVYIWCG